MMVQDLPFLELANKAAPLIDAGHKVYFKFTCRGGGSRQTFDEPDKLFISGTCEECGQETSLEKHGGGFMVIMGGGE